MQVQTALNQTTKDWHSRSVTLSEVKGLAVRFFATLRMTLLRGSVVKHMQPAGPVRYQGEIPLDRHSLRLARGIDCPAPHRVQRIGNIKDLQPCRAIGNKGRGAHHFDI